MTFLGINKQIFKDVMKLALPAIGEMTLYMLVWTVDIIIVGNYGNETAISAVSMGSQFLYTFVEIFITIGLAVALTSIIARKHGEGDMEKVEEVTTHGVIISVIFSTILFVLFFLLSDSILNLYNAKGEVFTLGRVYIRIASFAVFFNMLLATMNGILRGIGDTFTPFVASFILTVINIVFDIILVFGIRGHFEYGVKGAAIATLLANVVAFIFVLVHFIRKSKIKPRLKYVYTISVEKLKEIVFLAIPSGMQEGAFSICRLINGMMIYSLGKVAYAANQIAVNVESISFMPGWGVAVAATTLIGNKVGEKDYEGAKEYGDACIIMGCIFMGICGLLFVIFPGFIARIFLEGSGDEVLDSAKLCIMISSIEQIPTAISMIAGGILKGSGDTKSPFKVALFTNWIIRMPLIFIAIKIMNWGIGVVWCITAVQWSIDGYLMFKMYRQRISNVQSSFDF